MIEDLSFLLSSDQPLPESLFQGYFFSGTDFVQGAEGYARFRQTNPAPFREDGTYVVAARDGDDLVLTTDYSGYKKLFFYAQGRDWVVSNSLFQIAQQLRAMGKTPEPNLAQVAAMAAEGTVFPTGRGMFFGQLTTFETIIAGVQMVPSFMALRVGPNGAAPEPLQPCHSTGEYGDLLARFMAVWAGRFATLASRAQTQISVDLTGGIDSRAVLALALLGAGAGGLHVRSNLNRRGQKDLQIAQGLCRALGVQHNRPLAPKPRRPAGQQGYAIWRELCLGAYFPIYFPQTEPDPTVVHFGGGGGGNQRPVYAKPAWLAFARRKVMPETFVQKRCANLPLSAHRAAYGDSLRRTFAMLTSVHENAGIDPLVLHYREFRNRLHAGRTPQYTISFNPLGSRLLDDCIGAAGAARIERAQVFYDIMANADERFLSMPFDKRAKAPSKAVLENLTRGAATVPVAGRAYVTARAKPLRSKDGAGPAALAHLAAAYAKARQNFAPRLLSRWYLWRADRAVQKGFAHPITSKRVGVVLAMSLFGAADTRKEP